jgi:hypothetical protein
VIHLGWRIAGVAVVALTVLIYDPSGTSATYLLLPMAMALGAWLIVRNAVAVLSDAGFVYIGLQRFRRQIVQTSTASLQKPRRNERRGRQPRTRANERTTADSR